MKGSLLGGALFAMALTWQVEAIEASKIKTTSEQVVRALGCESFRSEFYDSVYSLLRDGLSEEDMKVFKSKRSEFQELRDMVKLDGSPLSRFQAHALNARLNDLWDYALEGHSELKGEEFNSYELYSRLVGAELGDRTNSERARFVSQMNKRLSRVANLSRAIGLPCELPLEDEASLLPPEMNGSENAGFGARRAFTIFYQSCSALEREPYGDPHPDLEGVKIIGKHPSGGNRRIIGDLDDVLRTHYYLERSYPGTCFNWRQSPPIYDFGGKTSTTSTHMNFFRNAGSGTSVLGIDCSAVIVSSLAAAGLRPKRGVRFKPDFVHGINSSMLKYPERNGLSCLSRTSFNSSNYNLREGDILAKSGHVTIVDSVGSDPWGLDRFDSLSDCRLSRMDIDEFDFTIIQSSPVKGAIGYNRMNAYDYFEPTGSQGKALLKHALNACYAKFGSSRRSDASYLSIVRHSTSSSCRQSALPFVNEACVRSCDI